jgi:hypothetical protein
VALPAPMELPEFDIKMHWHARHDANPAMKWLLDPVAAIATKLSAIPPTVIVQFVIYKEVKCNSLSRNS